MTKLCTYCEEAKPATSEFFGKRKQSSDGLDYGCRACKKLRWVAEKEGKPWLSAKRLRLDAEKDCGIRKCDKCGQDKPFDEFYKNSGNGRNSTLRQCKECHKATQREQRKTNKSENLEYHTIRESLNGARKRAKEKGLDFNIEIEDLMPFPTHCEVSGLKLTYGLGDKKSGASLDKVVPAKGYTKDNVRIISSMVNFAKSDLTVPQLRKLIAYIEKYE